MTETLNTKNLLPKNKLNPALWENNKLRSDVRERLLQIAEDFYTDLDIPWANLEDVTIAGSNANYNWSKYSDIDLHLIVDYSLVDKNEDLVERYFTSTKNLWNSSHEISINNFDVEIYVEDANNPAISDGVYSVLNEEWIKHPEEGNEPKIDNVQIKSKTKRLMRLIDDLVLDEIKMGNYKTAVENSERLSKKLKNYRQAGLDKIGEFSTENLVYKLLRRNGYVELLYESKLDAYDKLMSL